MIDYPTGYYVPLRKSLTEPVLLAGVPRNIFFLLFTIMIAVALGLREFWVLAPGLALYFALVRATQYDPQFFDVFRIAVKQPPRMEP